MGSIQLGMCGTGSESLIEVLCRAFAGPGDEVLMPQFSFPMFGIYALPLAPDDLRASRPLHRPSGHTAGVHHLQDEAALRCQPQPTPLAPGRRPGHRPLAEGLPSGVLLVLDSAYAEYLKEPSYDAGHQFVTQRPGQVVVLRTFQLYALAGLRWAGCTEIHRPSITCVGRGSSSSSLRPREVRHRRPGRRGHVRRSVAHNARWLPWLGMELTRAGIEVLPSGGNFVLARFPGKWPEALAALRKGRHRPGYSSTGRNSNLRGSGKGQPGRSGGSEVSSERVAHGVGPDPCRAGNENQPHVWGRKGSTTPGRVVSLVAIVGVIATREPENIEEPMTANPLRQSKPSGCLYRADSISGTRTLGTGRRSELLSSTEPPKTQSNLEVASHGVVRGQLVAAHGELSNLTT